MTATHAKKRLEYAREYKEWTAEQWEEIWFTDECSIEISSGEYRQWVWRHTGEAWRRQNIVTRSINHETVMIWAAMKADGQIYWCFFDEYYTNGHSATANAYVDLLNVYIPQMMTPGLGFLQDNASIHTADITDNTLRQLGVWVISHPPLSPDLNAIEHLWAKVKELVHELHPELKEAAGSHETKKKVLKQAIREAFGVIEGRQPWDYSGKLIGSMPRRIKAVIEAKGWYTKY